MKKIASGYRLIFGYLGVFLVFIGSIMLLPLVMLIFYPSEKDVAMNFWLPALITMAAGFALYFLLIYKRDRTHLGKHQDQVILVSVWILAILICAVPFALSGEMTFTESVFEATSGFATTGLTRFTIWDSHVYIFYRSLLLFFGGVGLVLIITSALSDRYGLRLYIAEGHNDKLMPNLTKSARLILGIYVLYILVGTVALIASGMSAFDAINHSIAALATGGFSSRQGGLIACQGNATVNEIIISILMILGGTNFLIHLFLLTGKFKRVVRDLEIRFFGVLSAIFIPLFVLTFAVGDQAVGFGDSIKYGIFTYISAITTSGFTNIPSGFVFSAGTMMLVTLMCVIGGGMGSTAGGAKQYRFALSCKSLYWSIRERMTSKNVYFPRKVYRCGQYRDVGDGEIAEANSFILLYVATFGVGAFLLVLFSGGWCSIGEGLFEFSNAISSTGLSTGVTALANNGMLWVLTIGMFAGRLEIIPIYMAAYRVIHDVFRKELD